MVIDGKRTMVVNETQNDIMQMSGGEKNYVGMLSYVGRDAVQIEQSKREIESLKKQGEYIKTLYASGEPLSSTTMRLDEDFQYEFRE